MPDDTLAPAGRPTEAALDVVIARGETCRATCGRALAAASGERDARRLRGLLHLEQEAVTELRARRDRLRRPARRRARPRTSRGLGVPAREAELRCNIGCA